MSTGRHLEDLARLSTNDVARLFDDGVLPDPDGLVGWEFRGYNLPFFTRLAGFQKFKKGFYRKNGAVWGYNIPVLQGELAAPWRCQPSDDEPKRFGFYSVRVVRGDPSAKVQQALLLDYGDGKNRLFEGSFLRDYVRQVDADNPDLLLGKAYVALGASQVLPSYFIIERDRPAPAEVPHPD